MPKWQRGSVGATAFANAAQQNSEGTDALNTTVTVASTPYDADVTTGGTDYAFAYGFQDASADPLGIAAIGSMGDVTYTDGGSTSRTITGIFWSDLGVSGTPAGETDNIYFGISGTSVPDTNTTFLDFTYNGTNYTRASRDTYLSSVGAVNTYWVYLNVVVNGPQSGTVDFDLAI